MFIELDNFEPLNDAHGREMGDLPLIEAARRLASCVREVDTVARCGGDELVVMLSGLDFTRVGSTAQAQVVAEKIRLLLAQTYELTATQGGVANAVVRHNCSASIGAAMFLDHEGSQDDLLNWADKAMYKAKESGRNAIRFFE